MIIPSLRPLNYDQAQETKPTSPDRDKDPFEELIRRLLVGEAVKSSFDRNTEFLDYYMSLGKYYKEYLNYSIVVINAIGILTLVVVIIIMIVKT